MSGLIMGLVLEQQITEQFTRGHKFVAVVYGDHAWQDGTHAHPAVESVARKTGYDERSIQRFLRDLEGMGMLIPDGKGPKGTNQYKFPLETDNGTFRLSPKPVKPPKQGGDTMSPLTPESPRGDIALGDMDSGDSGVTRIIKPSFKDHEEEGDENPKTAITLSLELEKALTQASVFKSVWPDVIKRLADGWQERDILAILAWAKNGGQAAARIREKTRAPDRFYLPNELSAAELGESVIVDDIQPGEQPTWWAGVLAQIKPGTARTLFEPLEVADVSQADQVVQIRIRDADPGVMQARLSRTIENALKAYFPDPMQVEIVSAETEPA